MSEILSGTITAVLLCPHCASEDEYPLNAGTDVPQRLICTDCGRVFVAVVDVAATPIQNGASEWDGVP